MANTREAMGEQACLDALVADTLTSFEDDGVTIVGQLGRHYSLEQVNLPNAKRINIEGFKDDALLTNVYAPNVTTLDSYAFDGASALESVTLGSVSKVDDYGFRSCSKLRTLSLGSPNGLGHNSFQNCKCINKDTIDLSEVKSTGNFTFESTGIGELVLPKCTSLGSYVATGNRTSVVDLWKSNPIGLNKFNGCGALCHLVLRGVTSVVSLSSSAFTGTGIAAGFGWIYVPTDLVDSYKAGSGWSNYASQIVSIEEYPKALQDETVSDSWATINASTTYATDYPVGSIKYLNVGGTRLAMQLVATETDDLAAGGKARMTWISRDVLDTNYMRIADWVSSDSREWLRTVIYPQIEQDARAAIKEVTKTYTTYTNQSITNTTTDTIWIPSSREVLGPDTSQHPTRETGGCDYTSFFDGNASRVKKQGIGGTGNWWYTRSASSGSDAFHVINSSGSSQSGAATTSYGIVLGFCI